MKTILNLLIMVWFVLTLQAQAQHELNKPIALKNVIEHGKTVKYDQLGVPPVYNPFIIENQRDNSTSMMALDSLHYNDFDVKKTEVVKFQYDIKGRVLSENYSSIKGGRSQEIRKIIHEYDDAQLRHTLITYKYDTLKNQYIKVLKEISTFDSNENLIESVSINYGGTNNDVEVKHHSSFTYNNNNQNLTISIIISLQDSITSGKKDSLFYDEAGNKTYMKRVYYNCATKQWISYWLGWYSYTQSGKIRTEEFANNVYGDPYLDNRTKIKYKYTLLDSLESKIQYYWDTYDWREEAAVLLTYDAFGNVSSKSEFIAGPPPTYWLEVRREEFTYDNNNRLISWKTMARINNNSQWKYLLRYDSEYDALGNRTQEITYKGKEQEEIWLEKSKIERFYTDSLITKEITYAWDTTLIPPKQNACLHTIHQNGWWLPIGKREYLYYGYPNSFTKTTSVFSDSVWVNQSKIIVETDAVENIVYEASFDYDLENGEWYFIHESFNTYNTNYSFENLVLPLNDIYSIENFKFMYLNNTHLEYTPLAYPNTADTLSIETYYYSPISLFGIIGKEADSHLATYPNPATTLLTVETSEDEAATLELFNSHGQMLGSFPIIQKATIPVAQLAKGIYFLRMVNKGVGLGTCKFIKE